MAFTRPWTRAEDTLLAKWYRGARDARRAGRKLHRSPGACVCRYKNLLRQGKWKRALNPEGTLPRDVPMHDPQGTFCLVCAQDRTFGTMEGRCYASCRCGTELVPVKRP